MFCSLREVIDVKWLLSDLVLVIPAALFLGYIFAQFGLTGFSIALAVAVLVGAIAYVATWQA